MDGYAVYVGVVDKPDDLVGEELAVVLGGEVRLSGLGERIIDKTNNRSTIERKKTTTTKTTNKLRIDIKLSEYTYEIKQNKTK